MSNNISNISVMGLCAGFLLTPASTSFTVPTTQEMSVEYLKEDVWVQPKTTSSYERTAKDDLKNKLRFIQIDFVSEYNRQISSVALNNAFNILSKMDDLGLEIPHIAANGQGEIGLTWDSPKHRLYLAVDGFDKLFLSIVNREKIEEYDCSQRTIEENDEILFKIRDVLQKDI